jgi:hypothetical protein
MHRELAALVPQLSPEAAGLRLHAGVNSGRGVGRMIGSDVRLDYGVLGDVVVLAQRLEAAAPSGETYVGEATFELTNKEFDFEAPGELRVKGKDEPIKAWRLIGPRRRPTATIATSDNGKALLGRERELASIESFAGSVAHGCGRAVFVVGEPGVGKTALCEAVGASAAAHGWSWLPARCLSYGGELAYWPFADLFRHLFGLVEGLPKPEMLAILEAELAALGVGEALPFIAVLCGAENAPSTEMGAQSFQVRLHESVVAVVRALAGRKTARTRLRPSLLPGSRVRACRSRSAATASARRNSRYSNDTIKNSLPQHESEAADSTTETQLRGALQPPDRFAHPTGESGSGQPIEREAHARRRAASQARDGRPMAACSRPGRMSPRSCRRSSRRVASHR